MRNKLLHTAYRKYIILLCILASCLPAKSQLIADFKADIAEGCAPLVVKFTDLSAGVPTQWLWDLGNGSTSTQQDPGTIYFVPGNYNIKLVVKTNSGTDSIIKSAYIIVGSKPEVNFSTDIQEGCVPAVVKFTDRSTTTSGVVTDWEWDFGDGNTSFNKAPANTYNIDGNFTITLKVRNSIGCVNVLTSPAFINVKPSPKADFTSGSSASCSPPVQVSFTNRSTGSSTLTSAWNFGDGNTSTDDNPKNLYLQAGNYQVMLQVTNEYGCTDTMSKANIIGTVTPDFKVSDTVCEGKAVSFTNTSLPATASSFWVFGDGTTSSLISPAKTFAIPGKYSVKLVNNFGACVDSIAKDIFVLPKPAADFSFALPLAGCKLPKTVAFASVAPEANAYVWSFGDSSTSAETNPAHDYKAFGNFSISLTVTAANGCTNKVVKPDIIPVIAAKITGFPGLPYKGCTPRGQPFSAEVSLPEPIATYMWDFGDSTNSTEESPSHYYANSGSYDVALTITTVSGCSDTFRSVAAVMINDKPKANFSAAPRVACGYEDIQFSDSSTGNANNWKWFFGDSSYSEIQNPKYHYVDTGYFSVTLVAGNNHCYDTITIPDYIYINPPLASYYATSSCDTPFVRKFINTSIKPQSSEWDFGDGNRSSLFNPVHTYAGPGNYIVRLRVTNNGCFDEFRDTVNVIDEKPDFVIGRNTICRNTTNFFTATNVDTANIESYKWDFGDSTNVFTDTTTTAIHKYVKAGVFSPSLTITDKTGCTRTVSHPDSLTVYVLTASLSNPAFACAGKNVIFTDNSRPFTKAPITLWTIRYGDNVVDSLSTPDIFHVYTAAGNYRITLIVTDSLGCKDSISKFNAVTVSNPQAAFTVSDTLKCVNSVVSFKNASKGVSLRYLWNFDDGSTDTAAAPSHLYVNEGSYNASLAVTDKYGCTDTGTIANAIIIQNAKAAFSLSDTVISCPPAQVTFFNNSKNTSSVNWDFDDGNFSNLDSPLHYFLVARDYQIKLIAYGYGACTDSIVKTIKVKGPAGSIHYDSPQFQCAPVKINFSGTATDNSSFIWDFGDGTTNTSEKFSISHTYTTPGGYVPKLLLQNSNLNCTVFIFGSDTITISGVEAFIKKYDSVYCDTAGIQFMDSSIIRYDQASSYKWNFGDGSSSSLANPYHTFAKTGIFSVNLRVKTKAGCEAFASGNTVKIVQSPAFTVASKPAICLNDSAYFFAKPINSDTSAITWNWDFNNGNISGVQVPPAQIYLSPGAYNVITQATNSTGCVTSIPTPLLINPLPNVNGGSDSIICLGKTVTFSPSGAQNYVWLSSPFLSCTTCLHPVASPVDTFNSFIVTGTSTEGCIKSDTVNITVVHPFKIEAIGLDTICDGEAKKLWVKGADSYNWTPADGLDNASGANPTARPHTTTIYTVVGHDYNFCFTDTALVPVIVYPVPVFNILETNTTIAVGNSLPLHTTSSADITNYRWSPSLGLSCDNCPQPTASPKTSTTYTAVASNPGGCAAQDQVTINTFCNDGNVFIPNTFSPNNDGENDVFFPRGKGIAEVQILQVFNRWGILVFQKSHFSANGQQYGWDGTYKGQKSPEDVYIYKAQVVCENGAVFSYTGNVTLIR